MRGWTFGMAFGVLVTDVLVDRHGVTVLATAGVGGVNGGVKHTARLYP